MNLLQMSFTGAVMILAVTVIRALAINKVPKKTFLVLWGIALVRLMIPFSLPSWFSIYSLWNREMPTEGMNTTAGMLIPVIPAGDQASIPHNTVGPVANVSAPEIIWILGCVLCAFFFAAAYWRSYKEFQMSLPVRNDGIEKWLETHPTKRTITVRQSSLVSSPLTYGVIHPVILLPKTTVWNNEETLHYVLAHELVHIKRLLSARAEVAKTVVVPATINAARTRDTTVVFRVFIIAVILSSIAFLLKLLQRGVKPLLVSSMLIRTLA